MDNTSQNLSSTRLLPKQPGSHGQPCKPGIKAFPAELLLEVFTHNIDPDLPWPGMSFADVLGAKIFMKTRLPAWPSDSSRSTRIASHVCQYWRKTVLNAPFIWSQLVDCDILPHLWFKEVLRRAQNTPLTVVLRSALFIHQHQHCLKYQNFYKNFDLNLAHLLDSSAQFREFHADIDAELLSQSLRASLIHLLRQPMPLLRAFTLRCGEFGLSEFTDQDNPNKLELFGGIPPQSLREFSLGEPLFKPREPFYQSLTYLCIDSFTGVPILFIISQTLRLQRFSLEFEGTSDLIPPDEPSIFGPSNKLKMPYLTDIELAGPLEAVMTLLDCLDPAELLVLRCKMYECLITSKPVPDMKSIKRLITPSDIANMPSNSDISLLVSYEFTMVEFSSPQGHRFYVDYDELWNYHIEERLTIFGVYDVFFPTCTHLNIGYVYEYEDLSLPRPRIHPFTDLSVFIKLMCQTKAVQTVRFVGILFQSVLNMLAHKDVLPLLTEVEFEFNVVTGGFEIGALDDFEAFLQKSGRRLLRTFKLEVPAEMDVTVEENEIFDARTKSLTEKYGVEVTKIVTIHEDSCEPIDEDTGSRAAVVI